MLKDRPGETVRGRHWMSVALSRDHRPSQRDEHERICQSGGRVLPGASDGCERIWLKHQDTPGLALTRSIGDTIATKIGLISTPEILEYNLSPNDGFIVLGSNGLFEFMTNEEVVKLVVPYWKKSDINGAC
jgi:serine/threonine protein phosphatase PrpC